MNKATFLTPKDYLRIITKKPLLLTSLTQKDLIFKSNTRKNTIGFEKKEIENLTKKDTKDNTVLKSFERCALKFI